jgi:sigma-B regulation protein RsbU (phosphoserine phosphatase)
VSDPMPAPAWGLNRGVRAGLLIILVVTAVDLVVSVELTGGYYAMGAILTSLMASARQTALVGVVATALALVVGLFDDLDATHFALRAFIVLTLVAVAITYAYIRERREQRLRRLTLIAETAQRAVLRGTPAAVGAVGFASRYVSASEEASIGGDLYEIAATPYGVRVIVGDVRGKGLPAVQTAASVLGAFRQAAFSEPDAASLARSINEVVSRLIDDEEFITAIFAEFRGDTVTLANCGHHPPLLIDRDDMRLLDTGEPTPPLGLGPEPALVEHPWGPSARLLLYTDGLVEARNRRGSFFPLDEQASALVGVPLAEALDKVVDRLRDFAGGRIADDVALVLAENRAT